MNREAIDRAINYYLSNADEASKMRLEFFSTLWRIQEEESNLLDQSTSYSVPTTSEIVERYWTNRPIFADFPVHIDPEAFARVCNRIAEHLGEHAGLDEEVIDGLAKTSWEDFAHIADLDLAGANPPEFVERCLQTFDVFDVDPNLPASIFMMVPAWALRAFLDAPAAAVMDAMDFSTNEDIVHTHPLLCPVCGTPATASSVAEATTVNGGGRRLYCSTCGTRWSFERIRCARCGSTNPNNLNWFHIEGDEAHRMQNCTDCFSYMRTVFESEVGVPVNMEVEDVVMVKLDAMAHDGRFNLKAE